MNTEEQIEPTNEKHWLFPKGNTLYNLRTKDGRDKLFKTPEIFLTEALKYFEWSHNNPWVKKEQVKTPLKPYVNKETGELTWPDAIIDIPTERPYSIEGLCNYLGITYQCFADYEKNEAYKDYFQVLSYVRKIIENQQFEGGMVGAFNPAIVIRKLGLKDSVEHSGEIDSTVTHIEFIQRKVEDIGHVEVQNLLQNE